MKDADVRNLENDVKNTRLAQDFADMLKWLGEYDSSKGLRSDDIFARKLRAAIITLYIYLRSRLAARPSLHPFVLDLLNDNSDFEDEEAKNTIILGFGNTSQRGHTASGSGVVSPNDEASSKRLE